MRELHCGKTRERELVDKEIAYFAVYPGLLIFIWNSTEGLFLRRPRVTTMGNLTEH